MPADRAFALTSTSGALWLGPRPFARGGRARPKSASSSSWAGSALPRGGPPEGTVRWPWPSATRNLVVERLPVLYQTGDWRRPDSRYGMLDDDAPSGEEVFEVRARPSPPRTPRSHPPVSRPRRAGQARNLADAHAQARFRRDSGPRAFRRAVGNVPHGPVRSASALAAAAAVGPGPRRDGAWDTYHTPLFLPFPVRSRIDGGVQHDDLVGEPLDGNCSVVRWRVAVRFAGLGGARRSRNPNDHSTPIAALRPARVPRDCRGAGLATELASDCSARPDRAWRRAAALMAVLVFFIHPTGVCPPSARQRCGSPRRWVKSPPLRDDPRWTTIQDSEEFAAAARNPRRRVRARRLTPGRVLPLRRRARRGRGGAAGVDLGLAARGARHDLRGCSTRLSRRRALSAEARRSTPPLDPIAALDVATPVPPRPQRHADAAPARSWASSIT